MTKKATDRRRQAMVIKKIDGKWYRVKGRVFPGLYSEDETLVTGKPIFDRPEWVNNFGTHDRHGYQIFQGKDGDFYTIDAPNLTDSPMFERIFDLSL